MFEVQFIIRFVARLGKKTMKTARKHEKVGQVRVVLKVPSALRSQIILRT